MSATASLDEDFYTEPVANLRRLLGSFACVTSGVEARRIEPRQGDGAPASERRPLLIFFTSQTNGRCRRAEGFLAQVLQRRRNHDTFSLRFVAQEERPDLLSRFRVGATPTLVVVDGNRVRGRLEQPRGCEEIQTFLAPWLR